MCCICARAISKPRATGKAVAKLVAAAVAAVSRAGDQRGPARRDFAKGAGHPARRSTTSRADLPPPCARPNGLSNTSIGGATSASLGLRTGDWGLGIDVRCVWRVSMIALALIAPIAPIAPIQSFMGATLTSRADEAVNDFANVIEPASEAEIERRILALKQAIGRRRGRRDDRHVCALRRHPRVRGEDVREPRARDRCKGQRQRDARPARSERSPRMGRGRLRPRAVRHRRLLPAR